MGSTRRSNGLPTLRPYDEIRDYTIRDYNTVHEPGPVHQYDRVYEAREHKYNHRWEYRMSHRPGSQIVREDEEEKPRRRVKRLTTPKQKPQPVRRTKVRNSPKLATRRYEPQPLDDWKYRNYLSYHEPGPYHDYRRVHKPGEHPYNHMWTYRLGNRPGSQHVRVEDADPAPRRLKRVVATPIAKPRPKVHPVRRAKPVYQPMPLDDWKYKDYLSYHEPGPYHEYNHMHVPSNHRYNHMWTYELAHPYGTQHVRVDDPDSAPIRRVIVKPKKATPKPKPRPQQVKKQERVRAVERKPPTPPPPAPRQQPVKRAAATTVVTHRAPPPIREATPPPRRRTPPPPQRAPPPMVTPTPLQASPRVEPRPLVREMARAAAQPRTPPPMEQTSRIPVRQSHKAPPPRLTPPMEEVPVFRREYRLRPESKWNVPKIDRPAPLLSPRGERPRPRWRSIKTYNGTPFEGPLHTSYGSHTVLHSDRPSYHGNDNYYYVPSGPSYSYNTSNYTGPLNSLKRTMVLFGA